MKILKSTFDFVVSDSVSYSVYQSDVKSLHFRRVYVSLNYWKAFSFYRSIKGSPNTVTLLVEG